MNKHFVVTRTMCVYFVAESVADAKKKLEQIDLTDLSDENPLYHEHLIEDVLTCEEDGEEIIL